MSNPYEPPRLHRTPAVAPLPKLSRSGRERVGYAFVLVAALSIVAVMIFGLCAGFGQLLFRSIVR
ncbi:MAG TPA: hypothetical protein VGN57_04570 [Pirellulaceae bacterium]|jgi:hypothetical protein|nr:hypothetical protein [Pirellulaceae bacterium]